MKVQRINVGKFAEIKEYLRIGKNWKVISEIVGLPQKQIKEIDQARYYKEYQQQQDGEIIQDIIDKWEIAGEEQL